MQVYKQMSSVGLVLWFLGCVRLHRDGNGFNAVFHGWHPLTWVVLLLMVVPCALIGEKLLNVVPLRLTKFWRDNADQLQWVTPFTDIATLKPFRHKSPPESQPL